MSCSSISRRQRTGLEALPELERVAPDAKAIVLSGFAAPLVDDDLGHRVAGYVQKGVEST